MAVIIVEDGSIVAGANSYISEFGLTTYAADRGITLTVAPDVLITRSMTHIETQDYKGAKVDPAVQSLQWPRDGVYIDGYLVPYDSIPSDLENAQYETCLSIDRGQDPSATVERATSKEKVKTIEVEYQDNASATPSYTAINRWLAKLVDGGTGGGSIKFKVSRG